LLIQEGRTQDAIAKYAVVARPIVPAAKPPRPVSLFRRIVQVAPMDLSARSRLIDQLAANGQVDEAIGEYLDLADIYYRLAELDMARKTYTTACAWLNRVAPTAPGASNFFNAWRISICSIWIGASRARLRTTPHAGTE